MIKDVHSENKGANGEGGGRPATRAFRRPIGPSVDFFARPYYRRVLRGSNAVEPGGDTVGSRADIDHGSTLGYFTSAG